MTTKQYPYPDILRAIANGVPATEFEFFSCWQEWTCIESTKDIFYLMWIGANEIRRKKRTININGFEVPEPLRVAPVGRTVFLATPMTRSDGEKPCNYQVVSYQEILSSHVAMFNSGLLHETPEAANLHGAALASFTKEAL